MKLHNLINEQLWMQIVENHVKIEEPKNIDNRNSLKSITITNLPEQVFLVTLDKEVGTKQCFNDWLNRSSAFINKSCDAVLISYLENGEIDLVFCELKSEDPSRTTYESQLVNTKLFFDYLIHLYQYSEKEKISVNKYKFVMFYYKRNKSLKMDKIYRSQVEIEDFPQPTKSQMVHYPEFEVIEYPCKQSLFEHIDWDKLLIL